MALAFPSGSPSWEAGVARILDDPDVVRIAFQPIVDLSRGDVTGYEALARFACEPLAGPDVWLERARALGLGDRLEGILVERALAARPGLPPNAFLTVNVSAHGIFSTEVRSRLLIDDLKGVIIEITEEAPVASYEGLREVLSPARERGAMVAVDDAGSGYAGLQQLLCVRPELVKLDRSLVTGIDTDPAKRALVQMLGRFVGELDAWLLAEGIESESELEALIDLGVPLGQGYRLGRPAPGFEAVGADVVTLIRERSSLKDAETLLPLVEPVPSMRWDGPSTRTTPAVPFAASVDAAGRPVALHHHDDAFGDAGPASRRLLLIQLHDDPAEVVLRAVVREGPDRLAPLVLCDYEGRYVGLLAIDRLAEVLARARRNTALA